MVEPTQRWTRPSAIEMATINVMGNDAPGIVKEVTSAVASQGIDILTVESEVLSAPFSGAEMFQLQMVRVALKPINRAQVVSYRLTVALCYIAPGCCSARGHFDDHGA